MSEPLTPQPDTVCPYCGASVEASRYDWRCSNGHGGAQPVPDTPTD